MSVTTRRWSAYDIGWGIGVALGITNRTDETPPRVNLNAAANTDPAIYRRLLGRTYSCVVELPLRVVRGER